MILSNARSLALTPCACQLTPYDRFYIVMFSITRTPQMRRFQISAAAAASKTALAVESG